MRAPIDFFPAGEPRPAQVKALDYVRRAYEAGYRDIVVEAPTGSGKSFISSAVALWAQEVPGDDLPGGYVLVNQKLLQDQMALDLARFDKALGRAAMIKSAVEYECPTHKLCSLGGTQSKSATGEKEPKCKLRAEGRCTYRMAKLQFLTSPLAITNYAYFFVERAYVGELAPRRSLCLDECHNLARLITRHVDVTIGSSVLERYVGETAAKELAPDFKQIETMDEFLAWLEHEYLPRASTWKDVTESLADSPTADAKAARRAYEVKQHVAKVAAALNRLQKNRRDWVFWADKSPDNIQLTARPLEAAPFFEEMVLKAAPLRVYLSAYPGPKATFCRELGLDPGMVAWVSLPSSFPKENRPVYLTTVGSLSKANQAATLPGALRLLARILDKHRGERGVIHSHSYALAQHVKLALAGTPHAARLTFPPKADERDEALKTHAAKPDSVLLSPSVAEGFDFKDDLARFQVIMKCPYPSLGDKQVAAKLERDRGWYEGETLKTILQACGRGVRHDEDHCSTYILDDDAAKLLHEYRGKLPRWFTEAIVEV